MLVWGAQPFCVCAAAKRGLRRRRRVVLGVDRSEDVGSVHVPGALNSPIPSLKGLNALKPTVDIKLTGGSRVWGRARSGALDLASTGHRIATSAPAGTRLKTPFIPLT